MKAFWLAAITACIWGVVPIVEKIALSKGMNPLMAVVVRNFGSVTAGVILWTIIARNPELTKTGSISAIILMFAGGALSAVVGQSFFYSSLKLGDVSKVVPIAGSYPLISFVLGILILGETVTLTRIMGVLCVVAGVILLK
jgi:transporter family protein